jgi:hypothetical protein
VGRAGGRDGVFGERGGGGIDKGRGKRGRGGEGERQGGEEGGGDAVGTAARFDWPAGLGLQAAAGDPGGEGERRRGACACVLVRARAQARQVHRSYTPELPLSQNSNANPSLQTKPTPPERSTLNANPGRQTHQSSRASPGVEGSIGVQVSVDGPPARRASDDSDRPPPATPPSASLSRQGASATIFGLF